MNSASASVPFAPDDQAVRDPTSNSSRPRSAARDLSLNPFAVSSRPGQLASRPARVQASSRPVQLEPVKALIESDRLLACFAYIIR
ncbi:hypothetical protein DY000_02009186 [Brassica cretica]|uniref:Uncharacterized protein n=1 Tax=Brassica cretica TaxID=69181 RepID=A0ABQ7CAJ4_BRACR|nr:hypothetical protein DY000_02009186 [Brassica cretica]